MQYTEVSVRYSHTMPHPNEKSHYNRYLINRIHFESGHEDNFSIWVILGHNPYKLINHWNRDNRWKYTLMRKIDEKE